MCKTGTTRYLSIAQTLYKDGHDAVQDERLAPSISQKTNLSRKEFFQRVSSIGSTTRSKLHLTDWKGTLESCKKVLEHDPEHIGALEVSAQALWYEGRYDDVVKTTSRLLMLNPDEPGYRYTRGMALMSMGKLTQASNDFRQALLQSNDQKFVSQVRNALIVIEEFQSGWVGHRQRLEAVKLARQFSDPGHEMDVKVH